MPRRVLLLIALLAVASTVAAVIIVRHRAASRQTLSPSSLSLIGDSLNVGTEEPLRARLRGWTVQTDDVVGRRTAAGLDELVAASGKLAPYVVVSLGTNDDAATVSAFAADVARAVQIAGPGRCLVWATIHRDGTAFDPFNTVLRAVAARNRNVRVVEWAAMIAAHPQWLAPDGIHATPDGYAARAGAIVDAMRGCHAAGIAG